MTPETPRAGGLPAAGIPKSLLLGTVCHIQGSHVAGGCDQVDDTDEGLQQGDRGGDPQSHSEKTHRANYRSLGETEQVEEAVEEFISSTQGKQSRSGGIVDTKHSVSRQVDHLVTFAASDYRTVEVQPVAGHIQAHAELEEKGGTRVQQGQVDQQAHGGTAVRQHVQHGPKPGPLIKDSSSISIESVQKSAKQVEGGGREGAAGHEVERNDGEDNPGITN